MSSSSGSPIVAQGLQEVLRAQVRPTSGVPEAAGVTRTLQEWADGAPGQDRQRSRYAGDDKLATDADPSLAQLGRHTVTVRYWAAAREIAGCSEEQLEARSLEELAAEVARRHGLELKRLLERSTVLVNSVAEPPKHAGAKLGRALAQGDVVEVLPPFAGG
ncbi:MAG: MoaD/ThiS family protein [Actinobacteria bacterium]|nr:MoaD/ThiS family protein [Actinomycetota bacterium]